MNNNSWWINYPWRMVQTNFREIDMENINASAFANELKEYHATVVMVNAAGIIAGYNTKLAFQNKNNFLHGDTLKQIIDQCHKAGIRVIARCDFSKIAYSQFLRHEDWAYRTGKGEIVNYNGYVHTCLNSQYQQSYIFDILKELFKEHDFDGLFCNMSGFLVVDYDYNYHGPCHCDNCKRLFKEQFGGEIPLKDDPGNPMYGKYVAFKNQCTKKHIQKLHQAVKGINKNIAVNGLDYQRAECNQDIGRPAWIYQASANSRRISGIDKKTICDDASTDFIGFQYRHTSISPALMELRQWQNLANAGSTSLYIMGTLSNHKDQTGIRASQKAFDFFAEHEDIFLGLHSAAEVLLVDKPLLSRVDAEVSGWIRALSENHIPFDEMKLSEITPEMLTSKKLVILADTRLISDKSAEMFDRYVESGGVLLATGETGCYGADFKPLTENILKSLGTGEIKEKRTGLKSSIYEISEQDKTVFKNCSEKGMAYIIPGNEVMALEVKDSEKTDTFLALIPEQPSGPPEICYSTEITEIPGVYQTAYGSGYGVYIPWFAGTFYFDHGFDNTFTFMQDVLMKLCKAKSIAQNCTPMCEITVMENDCKKLIQLVNTSGCFSNSYFEPLPIENIALDIDDLYGIKATALNGGEIKVTSVNGYSQLLLNRLNSYEAVLIEKIK